MVSFTERARSMVLSFMGEGEGALEALRISMEGSPLDPRFELTLVGREERRPGEREMDAGGFAVLLEEKDEAALEGAVVDFVERVNESGFEVRAAAGAPATEGGTQNENPKDGAAANGGTPDEGAPEEGANGAFAARIREVLDSQVNPAIASHGGQITLADVKETEVFLEMSGGCQGCAMSRLTLQQGVERMLRQSIPEITAVHDVTDHEGGSNPYF